MIVLCMLGNEEDIQKIYVHDEKRFDKRQFSLIVNQLRQEYFVSSDMQLLGDFIFYCILNPNERERVTPRKATLILEKTAINFKDVLKNEGSLDEQIKAVKPKISFEGQQMQIQDEMKKSSRLEDQSPNFKLIEYIENSPKQETDYDVFVENPSSTKNVEDLKVNDNQDVISKKIESESENEDEQYDSKDNKKESVILNTLKNEYQQKAKLSKKVKEKVEFEFDFDDNDNVIEANSRVKLQKDFDSGQIENKLISKPKKKQIEENTFNFEDLSSGSNKPQEKIPKNTVDSIGFNISDKKLSKTNITNVTGVDMKYSVSDMKSINKNMSLNHSKKNLTDDLDHSGQSGLRIMKTHSRKTFEYGLKDKQKLIEDDEIRRNLTMNTNSNIDYKYPQKQVIYDFPFQDQSKQ